MRDTLQLPRLQTGYDSFGPKKHFLPQRFIMRLRWRIVWGAARAQPRVGERDRCLLVRRDAMLDLGFTLLHYWERKKWVFSPFQDLRCRAGKSDNAVGGIGAVVNLCGIGAAALALTGKGAAFGGEVAGYCSCRGNKTGSHRKAAHNYIIYGKTFSDDVSGAHKVRYSVL